MLKGHLTTETAAEILRREFDRNNIYVGVETTEEGYIYLDYGPHAPEIVARVVGQRLEMAVQWHGFATGETYRHYYQLVDAVKRAGHAVPNLVTGPEGLLNPHCAAQWAINHSGIIEDQARDITLAYRQLQRREQARILAEEHRRKQADKKIRRQAQSVGLNYGARY